MVLPPLAQIFNPSYGVYEYSAHDNYILQINPEQLDYFKFISRILASRYSTIGSTIPISYQVLILNKKVRTLKWWIMS